MAALVYFKKLSEDAHAIVCAFGEDIPEMTRRLSVDRTTRRPQPDDENIDYLFLKASRKINAVYDERGEWPERGMSAS
ncbi:hypothetical protein ACH4OW_17625 [Streptomyces sp. NPDC017056]|uniref:hypothetical protein n=1 Tax=Streptomyces sp. NPDC017056 TaxID=3364973 RepID=UPI0037B91C39